MQDNNNRQEIVRTRMSEIVAVKLWETEAIKINFETPFKLVSGKLSPIYVNCRVLISDAQFLSLFTTFSRILLNNVHFDVIAGGETAGIPYAGFLAREYSQPMIYVRKKPKDYGMKSLIEGKLKKGDTVLLVEDLITDAGSKINFIEAIRNEGAKINDVLVVFDRQQGGADALSNLNIRLHSLCNLELTLKVGVELGMITEKEANSLTTKI